MIELKGDVLELSFPEVHPHCKMSVEFQRTLRIPDDGKSYPLPPGLGRFPIRHVDDHAEKVPALWRKHGGVMLPMFETEALWLNFSGHYVPGHGVQWPFALKIAAGKRNAVDGEAWNEKLIGGRKQDYVAIPLQPWLDGFFAGKGKIRQFVAMQMGRGYTVEEQLTGSAEHGGLQLVAYPMKKEEFVRRFPKLPPQPARRSRMVAPMSMSAPMPCAPADSFAPDMGLAAGGSMKQEIFDDEFPLDAYDLDAKSRCFVHLCNAMVWQHITGAPPPTVAPTAAQYEAAGLPWFDYKDGGASAKSGPTLLDKVKSIVGFGAAKGEKPLPENQSVDADVVVPLSKPTPDAVRDGEF